jgi:DNA-binding MarR family transcriptional regulator
MNVATKLQQIEQISRIIETDSALLIYFHLLIYGKSTPVDLQKKAGLPKSTTFRNLALLQEAGLVGKEVDEQAQDKRYRVFYQVAKSLSELSKLSITPELQKQAQEEGKHEVLQHWQALAPKMPVIFTKLCSTIFLGHSEMPPIQIQSKAIDIDLLKKCNVMLFSLFDAEDNPQLIEQLLEFLNSIDARKIRTPTTGMKLPVALAITMLSFGSC